MTVPIPLGVRIYNIYHGLDFNITRWVDDFSFRHTAPGGCASCTIKLNVPDDLPIDFALWGKLYNRVQIIDNRSAEILWEGRVEDPATQTDSGAWELGVLGSSVAATDINIPVLYMDNTLEHWFSFDADAFQHQKDDVARTLITRMVEGFVYPAGTEYLVWSYNGGSIMMTLLGRIGVTYDGSGPNAAQDNNFDMLLDLSAVNIDVTSFDAVTVYKSNAVPTEISTADVTAQFYFEVRRRAGTGNYTTTSGDNTIARFKYPKVQGLRVNRHGNNLVSASDYNHGDFVYVRHVVEDVVGRFLNNAWKHGTDPLLQEIHNDPEIGSVTGENAFIDTTNNTKITNLKYPDGTNAKRILDDLMTVQRDAYWAIWESSHTWKGDWGQWLILDPGVADHQFRFEWARWPTSWNYLISARDGMQRQQDGEDLYNSICMLADPSSEISSTAPYAFLVEPPHNPEDVVKPVTFGHHWWVEPLKYQFTRTLYFKRETPIADDESATDFAFAEGRLHQFPKDTGTLTVRRPVHISSGGEGSYSGRGGMVQPWEIRPGRLVKITDIWPEADAGNFAHDQAVTLLNRNIGFEEGTGGWYPNGGTLTQANDQKLTGIWSGKIVPNGTTPDVFIYPDWANLIPQKTYRLSGWVRCAVARNIILQIHWYDNTTTFISASQKTIAVPANKWVYVEMQAVAPINSRHGPALITMTGTPPASHVMWIDEMKFERVWDFPDNHQNCIFRVVGTTYSTSDNSCTLELDQLPKWRLPTQIANPSGGGKITTL